jgi:predicted metal-binding protein
MQIEDISPAAEERIFLKFRKMLANLEREIFLDGYYKTFGIAAGPCSFCRSCDITKLCKHPRLARPSMEACGIDVYQTARNCGFLLDVVKSRALPCSYISLILID